VNANRALRLISFVNSVIFTPYDLFGRLLPDWSGNRPLELAELTTNG
jgi:hypothetical protein